MNNHSNTPTILNPLVSKLRQQIITEAKKSKHIDDWFLPHHLMEVEKFAHTLCNAHQEADRDVVILAVWFHDIGRLRGIYENHDRYGAKEAKKILTKTNFPAEKIEKVIHACHAHRCKDVLPKTLEAKILATADAMSHFTHGFYLRLIQNYKDTVKFNDSLKLVRHKLERDFYQKMFFPEAKEQVKNLYDAYKSILQP